MDWGSHPMSRPGERLSSIAEQIGGVLTAAGDPVIVDATHDSRQVGVESVFIAVRGMTSDGHNFIESALSRGAAAVVCEEPLGADVPHVLVEDARSVMSHVASIVHGQPSTELDVVGITGTNGKTSVSYMLESILESAGRTVGVIGTVTTRVKGETIPTLRTTPEATDFQRLLRDMRNRGADSVVAEVSSHALRLGRVDHTNFALAAFTNLSQDHLDFHSDMEDYYLAKRLLFDRGFTPLGLVNVDDQWGERLVNDITIEARTVSMVSDADFTANIVSTGLSGMELTMKLADKPLTSIRLPQIGGFNAANALMAAACAFEMDVDLEAIRDGLAAARPAPGRFEIVSDDDPIRVVVDYAHTPDAVAVVIDAAKAMTQGRVIAVVGAAGDRDQEKRPLMGDAGSRADVLVVTSDNPRNEDPRTIIKEVLTGVTHPDAIAITERGEAIRHAVAVAEAGDTVLVLGKGHERSQEISGRYFPFDDRAVSRTALTDRREQQA